MSVNSGIDYVRTPSIRVSQQWQDNLTNRSSNGSNTTLDTVHRAYTRQLTPTSVRSLGSLSSSPLRVRSENLPPARVFGRDAFHSADDASLFPSPMRSSKHSCHKSSWGNDIPVSQRCRTASTLIRESGPLEDVDLNSSHDIRGRDNDSDKENQEAAVEEPRLSFEVFEEEGLSINEPFVTSDQGHSNAPPTAQHSPRTSRLFKRWISNLRPHSLKHKKTLITSAKRWPLEESPREQHIKSTAKVKGRRSGHTKTQSGSSTGIVDAVKVAVMARPTSTPVSRKSRRSNLFSRSNRSSKLSEHQARLSVDHLPDSTNSLEEAVLERSVQRQKTVEELVNSEASYVAD